MFQIYQDTARQWRWRYIARNGRIMADSGEGYASEYNARRAAETFKAEVAVAPIK